MIAFSDVVAFNRIDIHPRTDVPAAQNNFPSNIKISIWPIPPPIPPRGRTAPADVADVVIPPVPPPPRDRDLWNHVVTRNNIPQSSDAQTFAFVGRASQYIRVKGLNLKQMQLSEIEVYNMHPSPNFEYQAPLPSIVEEWDYPGAEAVFTSRGVHLYKGDGHIMLVDCGPNPNSPPPDIILVQTFNLSLPGPPDFCFKAKGTSGYLTMEIGNAYVIRGESVRTIGAKVQTADAQIVIETEQVTPGEWQPVGIGQSRGDATILELRFPYAP